MHNFGPSPRGKLARTDRTLAACIALKPLENGEVLFAASPDHLQEPARLIQEFNHHWSAANRMRISSDDADKLAAVFPHARNISFLCSLIGRRT